MDNLENKQGKTNEMKTFQSTLGYARMDKKRNADIYQEPNVVPLLIILKMIDIIGQCIYIA